MSWWGGGWCVSCWGVEGWRQAGVEEEVERLGEVEAEGRQPRQQAAGVRSSG